jgi:hypothetical protein
VRRYPWKLLEHAGLHQADSAQRQTASVLLVHYLGTDRRQVGGIQRSNSQAQAVVPFGQPYARQLLCNTPVTPDSAKPSSMAELCVITDVFVGPHAVSLFRLLLLLS